MHDNDGATHKIYDSSVHRSTLNYDANSAIALMRCVSLSQLRAKSDLTS